MNWTLQGWPASGRAAIFSLLVVAIAYLAGSIARQIVARQFGRIARRTSSTWDDAAVEAIARRIPFWFLLVGVYIAAGLWTLPEKFSTAIERAIYVSAAVSLTFLASEVFVKLVRTHGPSIDPSLPRATLTENIVRIVVVTLGLLVILRGLGLEITPLLTALGVGGLAVALALQDTLANLFAGLYLTVAKQIRIGNYVRLSSGEEGYLVDIDWRATRLRQLSNNTVLVPNAKLSQSIVTNYHLPDREMAVGIELSAHYGSNLEQIERLVIDVAREVMKTVPGGVAGFEPSVRFHTFGDPGIGFSVNLRAQEFVDQFLIKHEFIKRLHKRLVAEGIQIPIRAIATRPDPSHPPQA